MMSVWNNLRKMYLDHNILDQLSDPAINLDQNFFIKILLDSLKKFNSKFWSLKIMIIDIQTVCHTGIFSEKRSRLFV